MKKIIESNSNDWPQYYDYINEILYELETKIIQKKSSYDIKEKIFWFFRDYLDDHEKNITSEQNKKLFNIIKKTLEQQDSELLLLEEKHLSILEDILIILKKIYSYSDKDVKILNIY